MAPKYYWKGYLKLSLVTCPVAMTPATSESEKVRFHTLNKETGNRVVSRYIDSVTGTSPSRTRTKPRATLAGRTTTLSSPRTIWMPSRSTQ
ncbi:hypothetical protein CUJ84_Chr003608 [Rhizobium leguminosarum]|uniref:Ku domain-containing protein n=1 Tax=Rhizobium leguminosarum TaxID=384 RepID=A0A2K9Z763_RHILE|nr:hypothetical protein CUJ84_Chr003608 [Rhizobium leguminosarum]